MSSTSCARRGSWAPSTRPRNSARAATRALLFTGSFSTALAVRVAGISERIGYDRDGRGFLLTRRLKPPRAESGGWAVVPAVSYYWHAASALIDPDAPPQLDAPPLDDPRRVRTTLPPDALMTLPITDTDRAEADAVRALGEHRRPDRDPQSGGQQPRQAAGRPTDSRRLADYLSDKHNLTVLINGSPAEADLCRAIADGAHKPGRPARPPPHARLA